MQVKSSSLKLEVLSRFYRIVIENLDSDDYCLLVKFTAYFLLKTNIYRFKSDMIFIKIFKLKALMKPEEEYYLSIVLKAIELIENEFGTNTNKSENTNNIVQFKKEDIEEYLIEFEKKEFLGKRFLSTKHSVLNENSKL